MEDGLVNIVEGHNDVSGLGLTEKSQEAYRYLVDYVGNDTGAKKALNVLIESQDIDYLTNLPKRKTFEKDFAKAYVRFDRYGDSFGVVMIDIDHFKSVNDHCGHGVGDDVLAEFARRLKGETRELDGIYRLGGEEFGLLYSNADAKGILGAINQLRENVSGSKIEARNDNKLRVTFSAGGYVVRRGDTSKEAIDYADKALYLAKKNGRDRVEIYDVDVL